VFLERDCFLLLFAYDAGMTGLNLGLPSALKNFLDVKYGIVPD
jgi:hypothetical protein